MSELCPVCGEHTVIWLDGEANLKLVLNMEPDEQIAFENDLLKDFDYDGGYWQCDYQKGGCGSSSGYRPDAQEYKWSARD